MWVVSLGCTVYNCQPSAAVSVFKFSETNLWCFIPTPANTVRVIDLLWLTERCKRTEKHIITNSTHSRHYVKLVIWSPDFRHWSHELWAGVRLVWSSWWFEKSWTETWFNAQNCHRLNIESKVELFESVIPRVLYLCGLKHWIFSMSLISGKHNKPLGQYDSKQHVKWWLIC